MIRISNYAVYVGMVMAIASMILVGLYKVEILNFGPLEKQNIIILYNFGASFIIGGALYKLFKEVK